MTEAPRPLQRLPGSRRDWLTLVASLGIRPSKGLGQNFLVEHGVVGRIVRTAALSPGDTVIEVGPGLGMLTGHLLDAGTRVIAIELDRGLVSHLSELFGDFPDFRLVEGDARSIDLDSLLQTDHYRVVANLPYSVASAILMRFLEHHRPPAAMTVMLQREVAERIVATPPGMSVLSVAAQVLAQSAIAFTVSPGSFLPPPKVESAVMTLHPLGQNRLPAESRPLFFELVNAGFRHKRKQLLNSLAIELDVDKDAIEARLVLAGIDPMRRAQTLSVDEWIALLQAWDRCT